MRRSEYRAVELLLSTVADVDCLLSVVVDVCTDGSRSRVLKSRFRRRWCSRVVVQASFALRAFAPARAACFRTLTSFKVSGAALMVFGPAFDLRSYATHVKPVAGHWVMFFSSILLESRTSEVH